MSGARLSAVALATLASIVLLSSTATAYRSAGKVQGRAIRAAIHKAWRHETRNCRPADKHSLRIYWTYLSTVDPHFALAEIKDNFCNFTTHYFLRRRGRHSRRWRIAVNILDSAQECSYLRRRVPHRVLREFSISGQLGPEGGLGLC